nr:hypothetical protein [Flavivirga aquatica]
MYSLGKAGASINNKSSVTFRLPAPPIAISLTFAFLAASTNDLLASIRILLLS